MIHCLSWSSLTRNRNWDLSRESNPRFCQEIQLFHSIPFHPIPFYSIPFHSIFDIVYMPMWMGKIQMWRKVGGKNVSIFSSVSAGMGGDGPTSSCQITSASGDGERVIWWQLRSLNVEKSECFLQGFDSSEIFSLLGKFCNMFLGFVDTLRCTYLSHRPWKDCLNHDSMKSMHFNYKAKCLPQNQPP